MAVFKIYGSSAGSGKTFTLTKEYLKLVLNQEDPRYFRHILALTFTNDAANEMKSRILKALKEFNDKSVENSPLVKIILEEIPNLSEEEIKKRAEQIFHDVIHNYTEFSVKTIDSFVNQLVSSFSFDLNIAHNYEIRLDQAVVVKEAVDRLLEKVGTTTNEELSILISDFAIHKIDEAKSWNVIAEDLSDFSAHMFNDEKFHQLNKNRHLDYENFRVIKSQINNFKREVLDRIQFLSQKGLALITANELNEKDFTQGKKGVFGLYWKLAFFPEELLTDATYPKNYHLEAFENDKWYTEKNKNSIVALKIDSIKGELTQIGRQIYDQLSIATKYIILNEIENSILKIPLLFLVKQEMDLMMKERKEVFLSDFNRWILDIVVKEPVPFIYERIGEKYKHLLIDEFQDTSNSQFFNLLPLIENSLSNDNFNLIVGDVKQSVYKWRGGNIQLMIDLVNRNSSGPKELNDSSTIQHHQVDTINRFTDNQTLQVNFRSKKEIIEFNNSFFESLVINQCVEFPYIAKVFSDYKQELPPIPEMGGHVEINFVPYEKDNDLLLKELEILLFKLLNEGSKLSDIAILFRKNKEASQVANCLQLLGYEINSTDSLKLKSNSEVNFLVALLELVNNPANAFKKFEVLEFFFLINSHLPKPELSFEELIKAEFSDFFTHFLKFDIEVDVDELLRFDYFTLMSYFINKFNLKINSATLPYLYAFQDLVLNYFNKKSRMLVDFLGYWMSIKETYSIQNKKENALTITTIHKSKGLEYPIVIMPYANWSTEPNQKEELWLDIEEIGYSELVNNNLRLRAAPFKLHKKFAKSSLYEKILIQKELHFIENLNMLYVAFTRPIHSLYIFSPFNYHNNVHGVGIFLKTYLESLNLYSGNCFKYILKEGIPFKTSIVENKTKSTFLLKDMGLWSERESLKIKVDASILKINGSEKVTLGKLTHAAFELIKSEGDVDLTLHKIKNEGWVSKENYKNLKEQILEVTQHKELKFLFHENNIVLNEVEILSSKIGIQRPDRVVIIDNKLYVVDYKSGEKSSKHKSQLLSYGNLFREMGYQDIHLLLIYLDPLEIIKI